MSPLVRVCLAIALLVAGCGAPAPAEPDRDAFDRGRVTLVGPGGERVEMAVYVADSPELWRRGLMGWESLPDGEGMLFAFDEDRDGGFWMKDTLLELTVAYADADGVVHETTDMAPCERSPCPTYVPDEEYRLALEVEQGTFEEVGLRPGWRIEHEQGG